MRIAILTFEGFNELDSFIAAAMLNRVGHPRIQALVTCPAETVTSMNGVVVRAQAPLAFAREADGVATAGGCLGSHYLAAWMIARLAGWKEAARVVHYVAPVGQKDEYVARALAAVKRFLPEKLAAVAA